MIKAAQHAKPRPISGVFACLASLSRGLVGEYSAKIGILSFAFPSPYRPQWITKIEPNQPAGVLSFTMQPTVTKMTRPAPIASLLISSLASLVFTVSSAQAFAPVEAVTQSEELVQEFILGGKPHDISPSGFADRIGNVELFRAVMRQQVATTSTRNIRSYAIQNFEPASLSSQHFDWCESRYKSFRHKDNSYQPFNGRPRQICNSPFHGELGTLRGTLKR